MDWADLLVHLGIAGLIAWQGSHSWEVTLGSVLIAGRAWRSTSSAQPLIASKVTEAQQQMAALASAASDPAESIKGLLRAK